MPNVWFIGDAHLGHRNIQAYRDGITSSEENTDHIVECWKHLVGNKQAHHKQDIVWCLGDMAFDREHTELVGTLPGRKFCALGNHDYLAEPQLLAAVYEKVFGIVSHFKHYWVSHAPLHPLELYNKINVHGHVHEKTILDPRYINVSVDALELNFGRPMIDLNQLREYIRMAADGEVKIGPAKSYVNPNKKNETPLQS